jgi:hypothetical protein
VGFIAATVPFFAACAVARQRLSEASRFHMTYVQRQGVCSTMLLQKTRQTFAKEFVGEADSCEPTFA